MSIDFESVMTAEQAKKFRFALSANGVDPATVTINGPYTTQDETVVECRQEDREKVIAALKLALYRPMLLEYPK